MKLSQLKERIAALPEGAEGDADEIAFQWLKDACQDFVASGYTARKLLDIAQVLMQ